MIVAYFQIFEFEENERQKFEKIIENDNKSKNNWAEDSRNNVKGGKRNHKTGSFINNTKNVG